MPGNYRAEGTEEQRGERAEASRGNESGRRITADGGRTKENNCHIAFGPNAGEHPE